MQPISVVTVEQHDCQRSLPEWVDALSIHVARISPSNWDAQLTRFVPTYGRNFSGRIEFAVLDDAVLSKTGLTPNLLSLSPRTPSPKAPAVLVAQVSGSSRLDQQGRSCTLAPGDWCVLDTFYTFELRALQPRNQHLNLMLERLWRDNLDENGGNLEIEAAAGSRAMIIRSSRLRKHFLSTSLL